ncbi:MAG: hypothetical protein GYA24_24935 [Candidatus Lokiarchaeota archaeon]|nr:hypothetical protein [Candidatus Lokiarchaeota archaeon]
MYTNKAKQRQAKKLPEGYFWCEHCGTVIGPDETDCPECVLLWPRDEFSFFHDSRSRFP